MIYIIVMVSICALVYCGYLCGYEDGKRDSAPEIKI